ncbi:aldose 1-epimerase family protein [Streptosporangium sp. NBC_01756]|uniref:aldose 1-epimerase family protein n=1 Tax=Streptosporangium sp. NBC_01756 TaxID=2975950 RepID=UPI002DD8324E|nr:aldose 1-epimerase family protein [Streptosporangium sp. NBC_01756]WSC85568.1 aldose 1-epimerase family protein [Streptosporangium sp. NBC_01756]
MSRTFTLRGGTMHAEITERSAALRVLRHGERDLVPSWPADGPIPYYSGTLLAPWPNRIAGASYTFDGRTHRPVANEEDRGNALHGLVAGVDWEAVEWLAVEDEHGSVRLAHTITPSPGYPFTVALQVLYSLTPEGLTTTLTAENLGDGPAPYGCGPHPWLLAGERVEDYELHVPASRVLLVDDRLLPRSLEDVSGTPYDFTTARTVGDTAVDHAYTGLLADADGQARVRVSGPDGGVEIRWDASVLPWVQVCTGTVLDFRGLAVEPMTCPPDAFNSGTDLIVLQPGDKVETSWTISPI